MGWHDQVERMLETSGDVFGDPVVYRPASGGFFEVVGIWSSSHYGADLEGAGVVSSNSPTVGIRLSQFAVLGVDPQIDDEIDALGITWRVDDIQRDGEGDATFFLKRTA